MYIVHTIESHVRIFFLTGAECVPTGDLGLTHLVVSDNIEPDNIPVTSSTRVMVVTQQVCLLTILCVCRCVCMRVC